MRGRNSRLVECFQATLTKLVVVLMISNGAAADGDSLAPLLDALGEYHYPVSDCSGKAQQYFDQGLRFFHAFQGGDAVAASMVNQVSIWVSIPAGQRPKGANPLTVEHCISGRP